MIDESQGSERTTSISTTEIDKGGKTMMMLNTPRVADRNEKTATRKFHCVCGA
jgi:hypothetical protein